MAALFLQGGQWDRKPRLCAEPLETGTSQAKLEFQFRVLERKNSQPQGTVEKLSVFWIDPGCVMKPLTAGKKQSKMAEVACSHHLSWRETLEHTDVGLNLQRILS